MIRLTLAVAVLVLMTGSLMLALSTTSDAPEDRAEVSRGTPEPLSLVPALPAPRDMAMAPQGVRPVARPVAQAPAPATIAAGAVPAGSDGMEAIRAMSYSILGELKKPVGETTAPTDAARLQAALGAAIARPAIPAPTTEPARVAAAAPAPEMTTYLVQKGDSLAGIAFRFYGTTAAYPGILEENSDTLKDPSGLEAGMVLRIPKLQ
ncbi:LysM peptidoglycan-binding domain-containing protein [Salipiger sp.]|uniref:LysM peptidoglycan-binding domain-containing protein n=1 Tax=Salipiger sp. TaxID=2078585 RepID=UPI003A98772C